MRQVGIKQLKANLSKELQDLPFEVTTKGAVVALVTTPEVTTSPASDHHMVGGKPLGWGQTKRMVDTEPHGSPNRQDRPVRDLSKEAQAKGKMGH